jgi:hypothetical protein
VVVLRARDAAVADHRLGQFHGRLGVDVLTVDGVAMGEAAARPMSAITDTRPANTPLSIPTTATERRRNYLPCMKVG